MSGLFGGGSPTSTTPDYTGLQIQTAVNTLPVPIVWGMSKIAPNVVWYNNFQSTPGGSGGGGKGGIFNSPGNGTYNYSASIILALCEGPIAGINEIWRDQSTYTMAELGLSLASGTNPQSTWSYLTTYYPTQALAYQSTAYVYAANYSLSSSATLDNHNFEVEGLRVGTGPNGIDADPALVVDDFLTSAQYGVGFPSASIDTTTLFGSGGDSSYQTYCAALGLCLSPALVDQETASTILDRWLKLTNTAAVWSGGKLKFIPYGDIGTTAGTAVPTSISIVVPPLGSQATTYPTVYVCPPARWSADGGVKYSVTGAAFTQVFVTPTAAGTYQLTPNGTYVFSGADQNAGVIISYTYTVAASFVPYDTPIYNITDNDYKHDDGEDPIKVIRSDPYEVPNVWRLEIAERANAYSLTPIESRDQNAIELYGMRIAPTVTAHEICDPNVASIAGQLMLQRAIYIRNTYTFRLSWEYCLLDPMDLITVLDTALGLNNDAVRITAIEEDENGFLEITAEEFPEGVATATLYSTATNSNINVNRNITVGSVNAPLIFEPPLALGGGFALWAAVSASGQYWGGANVWLSVDDGASYSLIGQVTHAARMGVSTADFANYTGSNPDTAHTLAVNLTESGGSLPASTEASALALAYLCYIDSEVVSYGAASLTGANLYNVTYFVRGAYGSTIADHASGSSFTFLDNSIFEYTFNADQIGTTINLKFQSFNTWGGGVQSLADCTAYPFTLEGSALGAPLLSTVADFNAVAVSLTGAGGTVSPGIELSWTAVIDKTVTAVIVYYSIHGSGVLQHAVLVPGGGSGVLQNLQPATQYDLYATIATNPVRAVTDTSVISVTTGATQIVSSALTAGLSAIVSGVFAEINAQAEATANLIASVAQEQDAANWQDKYNSKIAAYANLQVITTEIASANDAIDSANANIETNAQAIATLGGSFASFETVVSTQYGALSATVTTNATALTDLTDAFASFETTVTVQFDTLSATVTENATALTDLDGAFAAYQLTVNAEFGSTNSNVSTNATAISTLDASLAELTSSVTATFDGLSASVSENETAIATTDGKLAGQALLTLDINGYISGWQAYNNGATSEFIIIADAFEVSQPGVAGGAPTPVFAIGTVDGAPALVLSGNIFDDGIIESRMLTAGSVNADNGAIANFSVGTLQIAGNSVTAPFFGAPTTTSVNPAGVVCLTMAETVTGIAGETFSLFIFISIIAGRAINYGVSVNGTNIPSGAGTVGGSTQVLTFAQVVATGAPQPITIQLAVAASDGTEISAEGFALAALR